MVDPRPVDNIEISLFPRARRRFAPLFCSLWQRLACEPVVVVAVEAVDVTSHFRHAAVVNGLGFGMGREVVAVIDVATAITA